METKLVSCATCKKYFEKRLDKVKENNFCGTECYSSWQRGRPKGTTNKVKRMCKYCGNEFFTHPSSTKIGWGVFCSRACAARGRHTNEINGNTRIELKCEVCGKVFYVKKGVAEVTRFCSMICVTEWRKTLVSERNNNWRGGKNFYKCKQCGKEFHAYNDKQYRKFCSSACYHEYKTGENSILWKGGVSFEPYPTKFNKRLKTKIRSRDNETCLICGKNGNIVHHVDYIKENIDESNLAVVCRSCHGKTNANREKWKSYFKTLLSSKYGYTYGSSL